MIAVKATELSKKYGRRIGISGIDLTVKEGDIFGLVGPDGAGKSTLLRLMMNYVSPSAGEAYIFDMDVTTESGEIKKEAIYVPADIFFYNRMKAGKYVNMVLRSHHHKKDARVREILRSLEVDKKDRFEDMDRSDQKKMALAAAIGAEPRLLLLDEPLRGLDADVREILFDYLADLRDSGCTIIITGRDADDLTPICNKIAIIENGEITVDAKTFAMENDEFIGSSVFPEDKEKAAPADNEAKEEPADVTAPGQDTIPLAALTETEEVEPEIGEEAEVVAEAETAEAEDSTEEDAFEDEDAEDDIISPIHTEVPQDENKEPSFIRPVKKNTDKKFKYHFDDEDRPADAEEAETASKPEIKEEIPYKHPELRIATPEEQGEYKGVTLRQSKFRREDYESIGCKVVSETEGKVVLEYAGEVSNIAKLLNEQRLTDICISHDELKDEFTPYFKGGEGK